MGFGGPQSYWHRYLRSYGKEITMRKIWMLALILVIPCSARAQDKKKPLPMPPTVSHNQPISNYACVFNPASQVSTTEYWNVVAFAEYGKGRKKYWSKSLGTFRGSEKISSQNSESAGSGDVIGVVTEEVSYGDAGKTCSEWRLAVYKMLQDAQDK